MPMSFIADFLVNGVNVRKKDFTKEKDRSDISRVFQNIEFFIDDEEKKLKLRVALKEHQLKESKKIGEILDKIVTKSKDYPIDGPKKAINVVSAVIKSKEFEQYIEAVSKELDRTKSENASLYQGLNAKQQEELQELLFRVYITQAFLTLYPELKSKKPEKDFITLINFINVIIGINDIVREPGEGLAAFLKNNTAEELVKKALVSVNQPGEDVSKMRFEKIGLIGSALKLGTSSDKIEIDKTRGSIISPGKSGEFFSRSHDLPTIKAPKKTTGKSEHLISKSENFDLGEINLLLSDFGSFFSNEEKKEKKTESKEEGVAREYYPAIFLGCQTYGDDKKLQVNLKLILKDPLLSKEFEKDAKILSKDIAKDGMHASIRNLENRIDESISKGDDWNKGLWRKVNKEERQALLSSYLEGLKVYSQEMEKNNTGKSRVTRVKTEEELKIESEIDSFLKDVVEKEREIGSPKSQKK